MDDTKDLIPAPPPTVHPDDRELGYGAVDARPDTAASGKVAGALNNTGESGGGACPDAPTPENRDGDHDGHSQQGYSGGGNPNATERSRRSMNAPRDDATPEPADHLKAARPDHGQAEDGKTGGRAHRGEPGSTQFGEAGPASERHAPGIATGKEADDSK